MTLEDIYGLNIECRDGEAVFCIDPRKGKDATHINKLVDALAVVAEKYRAGEISRDEYNKWRYNYPQCYTSQQRVKIPSEELIDMIINNKE